MRRGVNAEFEVAASRTAVRGNEFECVELRTLLRSQQRTAGHVFGGHSTSASSGGSCFGSSG
jgi:hypothetical protein